jgi:hypothetical protein
VKHPKIGNIDLGAAGIAGQAFTDAYTTVVTEVAGDAAVYMGGRLAYTVDSPNGRFFEDLRNFQMAGASDHKRHSTYSGGAD